VLSSVFIITEALIGAAIVLLEYVAHNASYYRAAWMALHLVNTFILTAGLGAMAWFFRSPVAFRFRDLQGFRVPFMLLLAGVVLVSTSGAVSALGQTLFPALPEQTILEHVTQDPYVDTPYPMLLRLVHPVVAIAVSAGLLAFARIAGDRTDDPSVKRWSDVLTGMVVVQLLIGIMNVGLSAPGWMQLVHLAAANALWLSLLGTAAAVATTTRLRGRQ
jgi:heme A synthase